MAVEPGTAATLYRNLSLGTYQRPSPHRNNSMLISAQETSGIHEETWTALRLVIDICSTVSDYEAHIVCLDLQSIGVFISPIGAMAVAALRRLSDADRKHLGLGADFTVMFICPLADASQEYSILVNIDSSNPDFGAVPGPGEGAIAAYVAAWLEQRGIETHWIEPTPGRPSVVGVVRGTGGGKSLLINDHTDTVATGGYEGDALTSHVIDGNLYGRGSADMKSGLACGLVTLATAIGLKFRGDIILSAVADEESESLGTEHILAAGWRANAAIIPEPTEMSVIHTHKGFTLFEVHIIGLAAHGSRPDLGIDAICKAGYFIVELHRNNTELMHRFDDQPPPATGPPNIHTGIIKGGEEVASFSAECTIFFERRTVAGESDASRQSSKKFWKDHGSLC